MTMSRSDPEPHEDGSNDVRSIDSDDNGREQLREYAALTGFQRDILHVLANEDDREAYGLHIKRQLEALYGTEVNHGRLYPNLNDLVKNDLIAKSKRDDRTNNYALTEKAEQMRRERRAWERGER